MATKARKKKGNAAPARRTALKPITLPALKKGEVYKGIIVDESGKPLRHVIELFGAHGSADWKKAGELAKKAGYALPGKREGALLRASDPFGQSGWFWLAEQYEGGADYAWAQSFYSGCQDLYRKGNSFRVRLVRVVVVIQ